MKPRYFLLLVMCLINSCLFWIANLTLNPLWSICVGLLGCFGVLALLTNKNDK